MKPILATRVRLVRVSILTVKGKPLWPPTPLLQCFTAEAHTRAQSLRWRRRTVPQGSRVWVGPALPKYPPAAVRPQARHGSPPAGRRAGICLPSAKGGILSARWDAMFDPAGFVGRSVKKLSSRFGPFSFRFSLPPKGLSQIDQTQTAAGFCA